MIQPKRISILGATGSIGQSTLDVVRQMDGLSVYAMSGHACLDRLVEAAKEFQPRYVVATSESSAAEFDFGELPAGTELLIGEQHIETVASAEEVDVVVAAIVGIAGLPGTMAAVKAGKTVALANKESLVVAGSLITAMAAESGSTILPVDSEHSAVFQAMQAGKSAEVARVILTASGGPFRNFSASELKTVTVEQALAHPTWQMGDLDLSRAQTLEFLPPDVELFPALALGFEVAAKGGTSGAVLNAANESAVAAFLKRELSFTDIASACREILEQHDFIADPSLEQLMACDQWARQELHRWISI